MAISFCAPENLAAISGLMKEFFDRSYYPVLGKIEGRPYAQMVCAGSDGENAARQTARIATGWRLKEVQPPLIICTHAQTPEAILAEKTIPEDQLEINAARSVRPWPQGLASGCSEVSSGRPPWCLRSKPSDIVAGLNLHLSRAFGNPHRRSASG